MQEVGVVLLQLVVIVTKMVLNLTDIKEELVKITAEVEVEGITEVEEVMAMEVEEVAGDQAIFIIL